MRKTFINPRPFNDHRLYQSLLGISGAVAITLLPAGQVFAGNSPLEDDDVVSRQRTISHQPNLDTIPPDLIRLIFSYSHPPYSIVDVNVSKAIRTAILGKWNHVYMMPEKLIKQAFLPKKSRTLFKASIIMPDLKTVIFDHRANDTLDFVETLTLWDFEASPHSFKNLFGSLARNMCLSHLIFDGQTLFLDGWNQFKEWSDQPRHQNLKSFSVKAGLCNLQTKNQISVKPLLLGLSNQSQLATLKMDNINLMNTCLTEETLTAFSKLINVSDLSLSGSLCGLSSSSLQKLGKILGQMPLQKIDISRNCFAEGELENLLSPMLQNPAPKTQLEEFNASNLYQLFLNRY